MPCELLACLDRCPTGHDARNVAVPHRVEVGKASGRIFVAQELAFLSPLLFRIGLSLGNPLFAGRCQVLAEHPACALGQPGKGPLVAWSLGQPRSWKDRIFALSTCQASPRT